MLRLWITFFGIAILAILFVDDTNASPASQKFKIYVNNSECLGIAGGSNRKGALLVVERCAAKASQVFEIYAAPGPAVKQTIKTAGGYCIDIPGGNTNNGSVIQQWDCDNSTEQAFRVPVWTRAGRPINVGRILAPHSGKCFDASVRPSVRQNPCNGLATQNFFIIEIPAAPSISVPAATPIPPVTTTAVSPNAAFLNNEARSDRAQMPFMVNALQLVAVESWCPVGCDRRGTGDALMYKAKSSLLASSVDFNTQVQLLKNDYCTRPGTASKPSLRSKNISMWFTFLDRFNNQIAQRLFTPNSCVGGAPTGSVGTSPVNVPTAGGANVEDQYWNAVKNSTRPADFRAYLNNYPTGKYASIARLKIGQLTGVSANVPATGGAVVPGSSTVEDQYWAAVSNSTNARDFQAYLNSYPNGKYAPIARLRIGQMGGAQQNTAGASTPEDQYWNNVRNSVRPQDFRSYLNLYPNGRYAPIARLKIRQLGGASFGSNSTPFPNRPALAGLLAGAQYGKLDDLLGKTRFWVITDPGDSNSKRKITKKLTKDFRKLTAASSEQVADFFVFFTLTDKNGTVVHSNTSYVDQTIKGTMRVFTAARGSSGAWNPRIVFEVSRFQSWDPAGNPTNLFGKHPADAAAGRFTKELKKIKF